MDRAHYPPLAFAGLRVRGFRSLRDVDLELPRITVLIGANGSGKSNLLSFLRMVALSRTGGLRRFVGEAGGASALLHYGSKRTSQIEFELRFSGAGRGDCAYSASLGLAAPDSLVYLDERITAIDPVSGERRESSLGVGHTESKLGDAAGDPAATTARDINAAIGRTSFFHFHDTSASSRLRANARAEDDLYLRSDGSNLAAYLRTLATGTSDGARAAWKRIGLLVRRIAPFVDRLAPAPVSNGAPDAAAIRLDWVDDQGELFGPHHLSDGTLRAVALITALAQPTDRLPAFISIDEPELGLHPAGLALFAELVRAASVRSKILLATQSPALLDHFEPEEVVVTERHAGASEFRRLDATSLREWLDQYRLSELFDKNVLGGRP